MLAVAVLAAGKGTRMKSDLPKVLQPLAGATLVERVLGSCRALEPQRQILIVGHQAERVEQSLSQHAGLEFVLQQPQNGPAMPSSNCWLPWRTLRGICSSSMAMSPCCGRRRSRHSSSNTAAPKRR